MKSPTIKIEMYELDDGSFTDMFIPAKWEICSYCSGKGVSSRWMEPSGGFTKETLEEDPEVLHAYLEGEYDLPCPKCHGRTTIAVPDENKIITPELQKALKSYYEDLREKERDCRIILRENGNWDD